MKIEFLLGMLFMAVVFFAGWVFWLIKTGRFFK